MKTITNAFVFVLFFVLLWNENSYAQKIDQINKTNLFDVRGSFSSQFTGYTITGAPRKRDPFYYMFNLNLNITAAGVSIPISATISQQQKSFTQPFNQFGLSPEYKAFKLHVGFRSLMFSEFSLSGSNFLGAGFEYAPKDVPVRFAALWGRFTKAIPLGGAEGVVVGYPTFERMGWGTKLEVGSKENYVGFIMFNAKDNIASIDTTDLSINPEENLIFSFTTKQKISKALSLEGEISFSALTSNAYLDESVLNSYSYLNNFGNLIKVNASTQMNKAIRAKVNYDLRKIKLALMFKRIEPDYKSLGTPFINNDLQHILAETSFRLFKNKLNFALTGGLQTDNLDGSKVTTTKRLVGGANVSYNVNKNLNLSANFANFSSNTQQSIAVVFDTLQYIQTTNTAGFNVSYSFGKEKVKHRLMTMFNYQNVVINNARNSTMYLGNLGHQLQFVKSKLSANYGVSLNQNVLTNTESIAIGPTIGVSKAFLKNKLTTALNGAYLLSMNDANDDGSLSNLTFVASYAPHPKHRFNINLNVLLNNTSPENNFQEYRAGLTYRYSFGLKDFVKTKK